MKFLITILLSLTIGQKCFATEWLTYYVYIQTEYSQGPWTRTNLMDQSGSYIYLNPKEMEGLFGSEREQFANAVLSQLQKATPKRYRFKYNLSVVNDTAVIIAKDSIADFDAVKNELVASFTLNNYGAVKIIQRGKAQLFELKDISVPYMDLVFHPVISPKIVTPNDSTELDTTHINQTTATIPDVQSKNNFLIWLIISAILNLSFIILFIKKRK